MVKKGSHDEKGGKEKHKKNVIKRTFFFSSFAPKKITDGSLFRHDVYINSSLNAA